MQTERDQIKKLRANQDVQNFLRDQMAFIEKQKQMEHLKNMQDGQEIRSKAKDYVNWQKRNRQAKRTMLSSTQNANLAQHEAHLASLRSKIDTDRKESYQTAVSQVHDAARVVMQEERTEQEKKQRHKHDLESLIAERARLRQYEDGAVTDETLRQLKLHPKQIDKLKMQAPSPSKYQNPQTGMLSPLIDSQYVVQHNAKLKQLEQRIDRYTKNFIDVLPSEVTGCPARARGQPSKTTDMTLKRNDSSGLLDLFEGDHRRREGSSLIARQIELENMKTR